MPVKKKNTNKITKKSASSKKSSSKKTVRKSSIKKEKKQFDLVRPPVIAVMGHVDHGKTSILDAIRETKVQEGEVGGITQNTRAHVVKYKDYSLTFIDTPGHEAFSEMRSRGAKVTDIVLLVVAANDGVQPQTIESIKFAQENKVPIIIAVNKIDLPGADVAKIKNQLSQYGVLVEEYGGDVMLHEVSAMKKEGLDELLEGILLQSEILELKKKNPEKGVAYAVVLESTLNNKLGAVALVLLKSGKIDIGDFGVYEDDVFVVRAVLDEAQTNIKEASESEPVWLVGLNKVIETGKVIYFEKTEKKAKLISKELQSGDNIIISEEELVDEEGEEVEDDLNILASMLAIEQAEEEIKKLNVVLRTDSQGTLEAVMSEIEGLNSEEVEVYFLKTEVGDVTRDDIIKAKAARGIVLGFQVNVPTDLEQIIKHEKVLVRTYQTIYDLTEEVAEAMEGMIEPEEIEEEIARAKIKQVFTLSDGTYVAGCGVLEGNVIKGYRIWVERNGEEIGRGRISSLKKKKDEVKEIHKGEECGIMIDPQLEVQEGDEIVLYKVVKN